MERRRLTALIAGFACLLLGLAAGCNSTEATPSPDAAATPAAAAPAPDKMAPATPPPAPPGPAGAAPAAPK